MLALKLMPDSVMINKELFKEPKESFNCMKKRELAKTEF